MILIENVTVKNKNNIVLNKISLRINQGEFIGIGGPNGAGKTTLLKLMLGFVHPSSGAITVFGKKIQKKIPLALQKEIAYVPQTLTNKPYLPLTVHDVVSISRAGKAGLLKNLTAYDKNVISEAVQFTDIEHLLARPIGQLSGGERKKVAIARAIAQQPRLLILDEPITNLDIPAQKAILRLSKKIHQEKNITTIAVMHDLASFPEICKRIILLKKGSIMFDGDKEQGITTEKLSQLYNAKIEVLISNQNIFIKS